MPKLKAYHRPSSIDEALRLLARPQVSTAVIGGGTYLTAHMGDGVDEVVDLQALGLADLSATADRLTLGAMLRLQTLVEDSRVPALLREAALREGPNTLRHAATVGGVVIGASRESELVAALLVSETKVQVQSWRGLQRLALTEFLRDIPAALNGGIVTAVEMATPGKTASARVARTPADTPIVAAVARQDAAGQLHLALTGVANTPLLVDPQHIEAVLNPPGDFRGSREYRRHMALILAQRVINQVTGQ